MKRSEINKALKELEPCNTVFQQRKLPGKLLSPLETHTNHITFSFLEGEEAIRELEDKKNTLLGG